MHKLRRYYYENKEIIWKIIIIIVIALGILQVLNRLSIKRNNELLENNNVKQNNIEDNSVFVSNTSSITGKEVSKEEREKVENIINKFVNYCNDEKILDAYNLLSDDCKKKVYPTLEKFTDNYYMKVFETQKTITIENWYENIYKVKFLEDLISMGKVSTDDPMQDYITITYEDKEEKLNINGFIESKEINKKVNFNEISINVLSKDIYMDYEEYYIDVVNNSNNSIMLDTLTSTKSIYLKDENNMKYASYSYELLENDLRIKRGVTRTIKMKFTNSYSSTANIKSLTFSKVILNEEKYSETNNEEYIREIIVDL